MSLFINQQDIDRATRRKIRSHVMAGRNAGRSLQRVRRPRAPRATERSQTQEEEPHPCDSTGTLEEGIERSGAIGALHRLVGHHYSAFPFATELSDEFRQMVHTYFTVVVDATYPLEFCAPGALKHKMWMRSMTWDHAYFYCTTSVMAACCHAYLGKSEPSTTALTHVSQAVSLVNRKLSGPEALSDVTVCAVLALVLYELFLGHAESSRLHMAGLHRIVGLRGGLSMFQDNVDLLHKICRTDLDVTLMSGCSTYFQPNCLPYGIVEVSLHPEFRPLVRSNLAECLSEASEDLRELTVDACALAYALNHAREKRIRLNRLQASTITLLYRLLEVRAFGGSPLTKLLDEALYIGLMVFLTTLASRLTRERLLRGSPLEGRFEGILQKLDDQPLDRSVCLWLLLLFYGLSVSILGDEPHRTFLIATKVRGLQADDWPNIRERLTHLPWIHDIHDGPARVLLQQLGTSNS